MRIDRRLNLVIPIVDDAGKPFAYVHCAPITAETFDMFFLPLGRTYSSMFALGLGPIAGPRIADKLLKKTSMDLNMWDGPAGVQSGLIAEIHRLTNVVCIGKAGWETLPYGVAKQQGILNASDISEVDAAIVFFIVISAMHPRNSLEEYLEAASSLWNAQLALSNVTEFMNSLRTASAAETTGEKAAG